MNSLRASGVMSFRAFSAVGLATTAVRRALVHELGARRVEVWLGKDGAAFGDGARLSGCW